MRKLLAVLALFFAVAAAAEVPDTSLASRGDPMPTSGPSAGQDSFLALSTMSPQRTLRPKIRPEFHPDALMHDAMAGQRDRRRGMLCGLPGVEGEEIGHLPGQIAGCGAQNAVRVQAVSGVTLSQGAVLTCGTVAALQNWVDGGLRKAVGRMGGGVAGLRVAAHYSCRTRNNQPGAPISEHGKAKAIDISEVRLVNGDTLNVLRDYGKGKKGRVLAKARRAACGPFGTVLGPGSDGFHRDHFHFDSARWGTGPVCR